MEYFQWEKHICWGHWHIFGFLMNVLYLFLKCDCGHFHYTRWYLAENLLDTLCWDTNSESQRSRIIMHSVGSNRTKRNFNYVISEGTWTTEANKYKNPTGSTVIPDLLFLRSIKRISSSIFLNLHSPNVYLFIKYWFIVPCLRALLTTNRLVMTTEWRAGLLRSLCSSYNSRSQSESVVPRTITKTNTEYRMVFDCFAVLTSIFKR